MARPPKWCWPATRRGARGAGARKSRRLPARRLRPDDGLPRGEVYLVGAGPGDPDLLDLPRLPPDAEGRCRALRPAGRARHHGAGAPRRRAHLCRQETLRSRLAAGGNRRADGAAGARQGKRVLRLKGGDPFIFGRGGEEIEKLAEHQIPFQVVPGVTAAAGCSAYAGIPLTHRDYAQSCVFVTGHGKDGPDRPRLVDAAAAQPDRRGLYGPRASRFSDATSFWRAAPIRPCRRR